MSQVIDLIAFDRRQDMCNKARLGSCQSELRSGVRVISISRRLYPTWVLVIRTAYLGRKVLVNRQFIVVWRCFRAEDNAIHSDVWRRMMTAPGRWQAVGTRRGVAERHSQKTQSQGRGTQKSCPSAVSTLACSLEDQDMKQH